MAEGGKFLIAAGTAAYDNLPGDLQLPSVIEDVAQVSAWFTKHGYRRVLKTLGNSPTADELRRGIADWFNDSARSASDQVVFYYSGHGEVLGSGEHYLLGRDGTYNQAGKLVAGYAYGDDELATAIASSPVQHVLVVLDTCFSANGIYRFSKGAETNLASQSWDNGLPHGIHVIAAAQANQVAEPGVFATAFCAVLENGNGRLGGSAQQFLRPDSVCQAINEYVSRGEFRQCAMYGLATLVSGDTVELLPNPRYDGGRTVDIELQGHWLPKVRSGAVATTRWYFTGREQALLELVEWLKKPNGDGRARVVTGSAGVGKSAVLAHLVMLADSSARAQLEEVGGMTGFSPSLLPPVGCFDVALHAHGQTLDKIATRLAVALGCTGANAAGVVEALKKRDAPFGIAIDGLEEAFDPLRINSQLLRPIASIKNVKLLVGLRPDGRAANPGMRVRGLGMDTIEIDLDSPRYLGEGDVRTYVTRRLLAEEEPDRPTPYRGDRPRAELVARAVAAQSGKIFLLARVIADMLVDEATPRDPAHADQMRFPSAVGDAFDELLSAFDRDGDVGRQRVTDVLLPLAYAEGAGLPWEAVWAPVASALAGFSYIDDDVDAIFRRGTGLVAEATEGGRSVYRLYHQELVDHLRKGRNARRDQANLIQALIASVPSLPSGEPDWLRSDPYVTTHLAAHAAHVDGLTGLIADPLYVAAADRQRLIGVLAAVVSDDVARAARAYRLAYHHLANPDPAIRLSYLELIAHITPEAPSTWAADTVPVKPWRVAWAQWRQEPSHSTVVVQSQLQRPQKYYAQRAGYLNSRSVTAVTATRLGEIPVIISGSGDGTLQLRRLADSVELVPEVAVHEDGVDRIAAIEIDGRLAVLSTASDGRLAYWEPMSGTPPRALYDKPGGWSLRGLSVSRVGGRWIAAIGGGDRKVRLVNVEAGRILDWEASLVDPSVYAVAIHEIDAGAVVVAGGSQGRVSWWRLDAGLTKTEGSFERDIRMSIDALAVLRHADSWCVAAVDRRGQVVLWDLAGREVKRYRTGHSITDGHGSLTAADFASLQDGTVLMAADFLGEVRVMEGATGELVLPAVTTDDGKIASVTLTDDVRPLLVTGEVDGHMRIWWNEDRPKEASEVFRVDRVRDLASGELNGERVVVVGTSDGWAHILEAQHGEPRQLWRAHNQSLSGVTYVKSAGSPGVITAGGSPLDVILWTLEGPKPASSVIVSKSHSHAVGVLTIDGRKVAAIQDRNCWIGLWDIDRRNKIGPDIPGHDHATLCLEVVRVKGRLVLASSGMDHWIRFWDVDLGAPYRPEIDADAFTAALAFASWNGRVVLFSGAITGKVHVWDLDTGGELAAPIAAHVDGINAIVMGSFDGQTVGLSAGVAGRLVAWRPSGEILAEIDLGIWIYKILPLGGDAILVGAGKGLVKIVLPGFEFPRPDASV